MWVKSVLPLSERLEEAIQFYESTENFDLTALLLRNSTPYQAILGDNF